MRSDVAVLLWKEFRQLPRKRGAVLTAALFPLLFFVILPAANVGAVLAGVPLNQPVGVGVPAGLASIGKDPTAMIRQFTLPFFIFASGLMMPSMMAIYTFIAERERRTIELLVALPVSIGSIVLAKLVAVVAVSLVITVPLLILDSVALLSLGIAGPVDIASFFWLLLAGLTYSTASAMLISLLARDYRSANNLTGALVGPLILVAICSFMFLPAGVAPLAFGVLLLVSSAAIVAVSLRWLTFERLLA